MRRDAPVSVSQRARRGDWPELEEVSDSSANDTGPVNSRRAGSCSPTFVSQGGSNGEGLVRNRRTVGTRSPLRRCASCPCGVPKRAICRGRRGVNARSNAVTLKASAIGAGAAVFSDCLLVVAQLGALASPAQSELLLLVAVVLGCPALLSYASGYRVAARLFVPVSTTGRNAFVASAVGLSVLAACIHAYTAFAIAQRVRAGESPLTPTDSLFAFGPVYACTWAVAALLLLATSAYMLAWRSRVVSGPLRRLALANPALLTVGMATAAQAASLSALLPLLPNVAHLAFFALGLATIRRIEGTSRA